jgi:hypothetical protein
MLNTNCLTCESSKFLRDGQCLSGCLPGEI